MQKVSLSECREYSNEVLRETLYESLGNIGFDPDSFSGARVALKPNLIVPAMEEKAITTDPEFFRAVAQIVKKHKGTPVLIESPAIHSLQRALKKTRYGEIVEAEGIEVADANLSSDIHYGGARTFKRLEIQSAFFDVDIILNLPKFKTHGLTYMTGAVKNLFGAIPGRQKSKMHVKTPGREEFSEFLLDLYGALQCGFEEPKTLLHLMDAVVAQEGEGPGPAGTPRRMNAILAGCDAVAVDYVATCVAGLDVQKALTVTQGFQRDFGVQSPEEIQVVGKRIDELRIDDFVPSTETFMSNMIRWPATSKTFRNLFIDRPVPQEDKCTLCYQCTQICPADVIRKASGKNSVPDYRYKECIRCYCCMEICPEAAIEKKAGRFQWMLGM